MKFKLLFIVTALFNLQHNAHSQNKAIPPCSPGLNETKIYSVDLDNDGYTTFDLNYYIQNSLRPELEATYNVSSSGYNMIFYNSNNVQSTSSYTNIVQNETGIINFEYTGTGGTFVPQPPNYCPPETERGISLVAISFDGDNDGDGISNKDEDANNNLNLMDDDGDNDGIINLLDPVTLSNTNLNISQIKIYPNPVTNGSLNLELNSSVDEITLCDLKGRVYFTKKTISNNINLESYPKGTYLLRIKTANGLVVEKIFLN